MDPQIARLLRRAPAPFDRFDPPEARSPSMAARQDAAPRRLGFDRVGGARVETLWLGSEANPSGLFETTIESRDGAVERRRYSTIVEACEGHDLAVRTVRRRLRTETWRMLRASEATGSGVLGLW